MESPHKKIKNMVKEHYADIARSSAVCCSPRCCGGRSTPAQILSMGRKVGYTKEQLAIGLGQANLGLGCGNPLGTADLKPGEIVLDIGSGAGFDTFLAAKSVGPEGKVIGVDMTPEMIAKARENAEKLNMTNVEFRLGEIEKLPLPDTSVHVVLSNCVINLAPSKSIVYKEIYRVLKPSGRISISDVLRSAELPREIIEDPTAHSG